MIHLSKRQFLGGAIAAAGTAALAPVLAAAPRSAIVTYRDPNCGCCHKWVERAQAAGFAVTVKQVPDIMAVKAKLGVPEAVASCHTSVVGGYIVEGHVPLAAVRKLLATRPKSISGIAVPGMPRGSPGMEMADGTKDAFEVIAFTRQGPKGRFAA